MNVNFFLKTKQSYIWTQTNKIAFHGYFIFNNVLFDKTNAIQIIEKLLIDKSIQAILPLLNGSFSLIIRNDHFLILVVDRLRGLPLFYSRNKDLLQIGDDVVSLVAKNTQSVSLVSKKEFLSTGSFISGEETLLDGLYQVQAGTSVIFDLNNGDKMVESYYHIRHHDFFDDSNISLLVKEFRKAYEKTEKNLVIALHGRTAIIPLSGGADSRMILTMLRNENYQKVICYTYGKIGCYESKISKSVAAKIGYPWIMVPYNSKTWKDLRDNYDVVNYEIGASAFSSVPHLQDYVAVKYLKDNGLLPEDSVFVPGHSGDVLSGNHIQKIYTKNKITNKKCEKSILNHFYTSSTSDLREKIFSVYQLPSNGSVQDYQTIEERIDIEERQAKYIVNSVRVYEFFGYEWLVPLWDITQFDFWEKVSIRWRYQRKLYYFAIDDSMLSTNSPSQKKEIEKLIRQIPFLNIIARRIRRVLNWYSSPLQMEHLFPAKNYFWACLFRKSSFTVSSLESERILKQIKKGNILNE